MRFTKVTIQNFRNIPLATVALAGRRTFLCGANGQGKTNFLEAVGYVTALRSFRGAEPGALLALGQTQAGMAFEIDHESFGPSRLTVQLSNDGREVMWEQGKVSRLADFIGKFPTVVFSAQDSQFMRGAPATRRRWLDLTLAAMDPSYLLGLQSYHRALSERNALLKQGGRDADSLKAFEHELALHAVTLVERRTAGVARLRELFCRAHARLVPGGESAGLIYSPDSVTVSREEFAAELVASRPRDTMLKSTSIGPHRDDVELLLNGRPAKHFASEGQQRCLVVALRLAQAAYYQMQGGVAPVLLCDDVLGELDPERRAKFWAALEGEPQMIATGTSLPEGAGADWDIFEVKAGAMTPAL